MSNKETAMLKLVNLKKFYNVAGQEIAALKGIDLQFKANEFVSILGPSGCGKTTMLNLIGGLDKYSEGDVVINGTSTKEFKDSDWDAYRNNSIGFVFQSYNLIPHLTILGNVELALTLSGISRSERVKRATEVLTKVGLELHIDKKPNQLSGGQMQRVAIARALINNPDIILADEPTGALDTETSVQIMELLKEVAKEKLVIMVTHNPELAEQYSTRIVKCKDGSVVEDSNPFKEVKAEDSTFMPKKTAMPYKMALSLSLKNLLSKKARTIITAIAGSIGITGIACVLALSSGFQTYIDEMQEQLTTEYPLELSQYTVDIESSMNSALESQNGDKFPTGETVTSDSFNFGDRTMHTNIFSQDFIDHLLEVDKSYYNEIMLNYGLNLNVYYEDLNSDYINVETEAETNSNFMMEMMMPTASPWGQLVSNEDFLLSQYDVLKGNLPTAWNEIVIFVDEYNKIDADTLKSLGIKDESVTFDELLNHSFKIFTNDQMYKKDSTTTTFLDDFELYKFSEVTQGQTWWATGTELKIVGVMRVKETTSVNSFSSTIGYSHLLSEHLIKTEAESEIVDYMVNHPFYDETSFGNYLTSVGYDPSTDADGSKLAGIVSMLEFYKMIIDPFTGDVDMEAFIQVDSTTEGAVQYLLLLGDLDYYTLDTNFDFYNAALYGGEANPTSIAIYATTLDAKEAIKEQISSWNDKVGEDSEYRILYIDSVEMMVGSLNTMVAAISGVLIAFTSISLVVSSVMIGIITYVSVIERTKEIGVLRSIGARKKDISRVFNAETIIIGFTAGFIAVSFTYLISLPINIVVEQLIDITNIASLHPISAVILIVISIMLTYIAGLIPSKAAAKKDPVTALRSE